MGLLDWLTDAGAMMGGGIGMPPMPPGPPPVQSLDIPPAAMRGAPPMPDFGNAPPQLAPTMMDWAPPGAPPEAAGRFMSPPMPPVQDNMLPPPDPRHPEVPQFPTGPMPGHPEAMTPPMPPNMQPRFNPAQSGDLPPLATRPGMAPDATVAPPLPPPTTVGGPPMPPRAPAGPPTSLAPPAPGAPPPIQVNRGGGEGMGSSFLGRALGLNTRDDRTLRGSLSAGLKAVGENSNKPGLAAFAGSAGSAMEGGEKAVQRDMDERTKVLTAAIAAKRAGDEAGYKTNYLQYLKMDSERRLELSKEKMANPSTGRNAAWNKPDSEKIKDIENILAKDLSLKTLANKAKSALLPADQAKAQVELDTKTAERKAALAKQFGVDLDNPRGTAANPYDVSSIKNKSDFFKRIRPGDYYKDQHGNYRIANNEDGTPFVREPGAMTAPPSAPTTTSVAPDADDDDDED